VNIALITKYSGRVLAFYDMNKKDVLRFTAAQAYETSTFLEGCVEIKQNITKSTSTDMKKDDKIQITTGLVIYGRGGIYLWSPQGGVIELLKNSFTYQASTTPDGKQLITGGSDGVCRVWNISNLKRPVLISFTRGSTFYVQDVLMNSYTQISAENRGALITQEEVKTDAKSKDTKSTDVETSVKPLTIPKVSELPKEQNTISSPTSPIPQGSVSPPFSLEPTSPKPLTTPLPSEQTSTS